jgi:hypothetical protein
MAKRKQPEKQGGGPYLAAAFFCENVIEDRSGALSAIRMIDKIDIDLDATAPPDFPSEENKLPVAVSAVLSFKTGDAPGKHTISAELIPPSGKKNQPFEQTGQFSEEPHGGANIHLKLIIKVVKGGLFWLNVSLDGTLVTRMPLQITIRRTSLPQSQPIKTAGAT